VWVGVGDGRSRPVLVRRRGSSSTVSVPAYSRQDSLIWLARGALPSDAEAVNARNWEMVR
jgi:hypothetical protein